MTRAYLPTPHTSKAPLSFVSTKFRIPSSWLPVQSLYLCQHTVRGTSFLAEPGTLTWKCEYYRVLRFPPVFSSDKITLSCCVPPHNPSESSFQHFWIATLLKNLPRDVWRSSDVGRHVWLLGTIKPSHKCAFLQLTLMTTLERRHQITLSSSCSSSPRTSGHIPYTETFSIRQCLSSTHYRPPWYWRWEYIPSAINSNCMFILQLEAISDDIFVVFLQLFHWPSEYFF